MAKLLSGTRIYGTANVDSILYVNTSISIGNSTIVLANTTANTFVANLTQLTISTPVSANGGVGTSGQILTSNGSTGSPYWAAGGGGFTNGQSIAVSNIAFANTSNGAATYTYYNSTTKTLDTVFI
jgi:hypothetical protein